MFSQIHEALLGSLWRGHGGDIFRLDYIFEKKKTKETAADGGGFEGGEKAAAEDEGTWTVSYKKVSQLTPLQHEKSPKLVYCP